MKSRDANRKVTILEDQLDLLKDAEAFYSSRYFLDAIGSGSEGAVRAHTYAAYFARYDNFVQGNTFADSCAAKLSDLPGSNGQRWFRKLPYTIGIICDDFLHSSFENSVDLVRVTPNNYTEAAERCDLLLVTTTWRGMDNEWLLLGSIDSYSWRRLTEKVIPVFRQAGKPVGFYSKEDPPNYMKFRHLAGLCDFAFTSAAESVAKYEGDCANLNSVDVLPFSVSAQHHNPVGSRIVRIPDVLFAGSWFNRKYSARRSHGMRILTGVENSDRDLVIIDRNSQLRRIRYAFPEQFLRSMNRSVEHDQLLRLQKSTEININLNSVSASDTMYANRAIELQAMGSCLISSYNKGINSLFPNIFMPDTAVDTRDLINALTPELLLRAQMQGVRNAWGTNTNFDRIATICAAAGLSVPTTSRLIGVIGADHARMNEFVTRQISTDPAIEIRSFADEPEALRAGASAITFPDPDYVYSPHFVQDLANAFKYVDADQVCAPVDYSGPWENFIEHNYMTESPAGATSLTWVDQNSPPNGVGYAVQRGLVSTSAGITVRQTRQPTLSVIVPIYNNGRHLEFKCLASLRRSSIFDQMEIILIDDGSSDTATREVLEMCERAMANVVVYRNPEGGSGSASRPRNQGLEIATGKYVTYLDPDNEAMNDAYATLVELIEQNHTNFAIGNMLKFDTARRVINNVIYLKQSTSQDLSADNIWRVPSDVLTRLDFRPMSIQALVADTAWLKSLRLVQPVGGVGQDSYFFQQMTHYADAISLFDECVHVYFAGTANSTVNTIGANFFRRYLPLERDRAAWLRSTGLLDDYVQVRLEQFVGGWFMQKLDRVHESERAEAFGLLQQIIAMYTAPDHTWHDTGLSDRLQALTEEFAVPGE